jgi:putative ABC transport system substrate-binding protein
MQRRTFIILVGAAAGLPLAVRAKQKAPVIGILHAGNPELMGDHLLVAFRKGLSETGYVEGQNLTIEYRWAQNDTDRLPRLAADLVDRRVAVIVTPASTAAALAAKAATASIPIVFITGADPVKIGLVASLNRPGGNVTGVADIGVELAAKRLGLLLELLSGSVRLAMLVNAKNPSITKPFVAEVLAAASAIGQPIETVTASANSEIDAAFATLAAKRTDAYLISPDALFVTQREQILRLAERYAIPAMYHRREFVDAGGLMSYGSSLADQFRQTGVYAGRILTGAKPADLPVEQPTKFELVINLKTAKALGLTVPQSLLARADEVIE